MLKHTTIVFLILLLIVPLVAAQDALTETFTAPDNSLTFQYPASWSVEVNDDDVIVLSLSRARRLRSLISIFTPVVIDRMGFGDETDPSKLVKALGAFFENKDGGDLSQIKIGDTTGARYSYINRDDSQPNLLIAVPVADKLIMLWASTSDDNIDEIGDVAAAVAATFTQPTTTPASLEQYDASWQEAVAELEQVGLIATGGDLIFRENRAFFSGQGNWFTPLAERAPRTDIVLAGELTFRPGSDSELERCTLLSRITTDNEGRATRFLDVGVDSNGKVYYLDRDDASSTDSVRLRNSEITDPHHFLILALNDQLTVYIDGQRTFEKVPITERAGTYGVALSGRGPQALCEATNIWAYEASTFQPGVCEISAANTVNKRGGPGTTYDVAGQLAANVEHHAQGQATGTDGFIWWQLDDDTWVRNDVVSAKGDCRNIPEVTAE